MGTFLDGSGGRPEETNDKEMESCYPLYLTMTFELRNALNR